MDEIKKRMEEHNRLSSSQKKYDDKSKKRKSRHSSSSSSLSSGHGRRKRKSEKKMHATSESSSASSGSSGTAAPQPLKKVKRRPSVDPEHSDVLKKMDINSKKDSIQKTRHYRSHGRESDSSSEEESPVRRTLQSKAKLTKKGVARSSFSSFSGSSRSRSASPSPRKGPYDRRCG